jgi:tetratricopeptide (TPR) repeat protein
VPDAWLAVGDHRFYASNDWNGALEAYGHVLDHPASDAYAMALFKTAWCNWKLGNSAEAVKRFKQVLDQGGSEQTDEAGRKRLADLREEALEYLVQVLSEDEKNTPKDIYDFLASIDGSQYSRKVLVRLGEAYEAQTRYDKSVPTWRFLIELDGKHVDAADFELHVVAGLRGDGKLPAALDELGIIHERYGLGTAWAKANPMLEHGVVSLQYLQQESDKARARPEKLASFIRYHAKNRRVSSAEQLISIDKWDACYDPTRQPDPKISPHGGVDLGWVDDLAAFALVWPCEIDGRRCYVVRSWAWIPLETPHHDLDIDPWSSWIRHQHLHTVPGPVMRVQTFYDTIADLHKRHAIKTVAYDPNNLREIAGHCDDLGIDTYGFLQRASKYNEPIKELLAAVQERRIFHDGNPVLRWCVANLVTKSDEHGYRMPDKKASKSKIDVAVALLMALSEAMFGQFSAPKYVPEPTLL